MWAVWHLAHSNNRQPHGRCLSLSLFLFPFSLLPYAMRVHVKLPSHLAGVLGRGALAALPPSLHQVKLIKRDSRQNLVMMMVVSQS